MVLINNLIGHFGKYHLWLSAIVFLSKLFVAFHQMAIFFLAPPVQYTCPGNNTCCDIPVYNKTDFTRTIVTEWNLICEKSWLKYFTQTIFQFGVLIGSLSMGLASDRYGRRKALIIAMIFETFTGMIAAFMPDYWSFTIVRMILGIAVGGVTVVSFVLLMEIVGCAYRDVVSIIFHIPFTVGHIMLPLFGYFIRDFVRFQMAISSASVIQLLYICVLPESPRWLLSNNKTFQAIKVMERIAEINNLPKCEIRRQIETYQMECVGSRQRRQYVIDLFRNSYLRKNILVMALSWFVSGYCHYGVSHFISRLTGNIFINVVVNGCICLCGCLLVIPLIKYIGRRTLVITCNIASAICMLFIAFVPEGIESLMLGCVGDLFCFMGYIVLYLYCSEIFPTGLRNAAVGISSMMARFGSMIAPFVADFRIHGKWCAPVAFCLPLIIASSLFIFLPETKGTELVMSIEEAQKLRRSTYSTPKNTVSNEFRRSDNN